MKGKLFCTLLVLGCMTYNNPAFAFKYEHYDNAPDYCIQEFQEVFKTIKAEDDAIYEKIQFEEDTRMFMDDYLDKRVTAETNARKKQDTVLQQNIDNEVNNRITEDNIIKEDLKNNWADHQKLEESLNNTATLVNEHSTTLNNHEQRITNNSNKIETYNNQSIARDTRLENKTEMNRQEINVVKNDLKNNWEDHKRLDQQYQSTQNQITNLSNQMDRQYNQVNQRLNKLDEKIEGGLATVTALTALHPNPRCNTKTQVAVGAGMYADNVAGAVGLFHWINDRVMLNAGASYGGDSQWAGNCGLSIGIGKMK